MKCKFRLLVIFLINFLVCSLLKAAPARITDLTAVQTNGGVILLWTVPSGSSLTNIELRYSTSSINTLNWSGKSKVPWLTDPGSPGTIQTVTVLDDLTNNTTYYFALKTQDNNGVWSTMSNQALSEVGGQTYSVRLAWDPSPDGFVETYFMYVGTESGIYEVTTNNVGNKSSCIVSNLNWGITYYFAVTAALIDTPPDVYLESEKSNEVSHHRP